MRNLKRALSLTLASVMLLGMMVVGTSAAAGYDDVKETDNVEAIEVLQEIEVMVGDERGFGPDRPVNRAEMAVVMGKLLSLDYDYYSTSCPFNDVYDWARGWVGAAYANKILSGRSATVYDPGSSVTAVEAASMLMRALGYFQYANDTVDGFELSTVRQGTKIGIFDGVGSSATDPMTRNQVAQMVLNALQCGVVEPDGNTINLTTPDGTVLTGKVNYVYVTSNKDFAKAISQTPASSMGSYNDSPIVELGERLYNGDLRLDKDERDVFGRPARKWDYKGEEIGIYAKREQLRKSWTVKVEGGDVYSDVGAAASQDYPLTYWINGVRMSNADADAEQAKFERRNDDQVGTTGKGVLTEAYVDTTKDDEKLTIVEIHTYLAYANNDYDSRNDKLSINIYEALNGKDDPGQASEVILTRSLSGEDFDIDGYEQDDLMLVTYAGRNKEVQSVAEPELVADVYVNSYSTGDHDDNDKAYMMSSVTADGTKYDAAYDAVWDPEYLYNYDTSNGLLKMKDHRYNLYLDQYGYVIGLENVKANTNYAFLVGYQPESDVLAKTIDRALVILIDEETGTATMKTTKAQVKDLSDDDKGQLFGTGETDFKTGAVNKWITYTMDGDVMVIDSAVDTQYIDGTATVIDKENVTLEGDLIDDDDNDYGNDNASVVKYGNTKTVYVAVDADYSVVAGTGGPPFTAGGSIVDINGTTVGVRNTNIDVGTGVVDASGAYVLFESGSGYIKYAVVVGENTGSQNFVYLTKLIKQADRDDEKDKDVFIYEGFVNGTFSDRIESLVSWSGAVKNGPDLKEGVIYKAKINSDGRITQMDAQDDNWEDATQTDNRTDGYVQATSGVTTNAVTLDADTKVWLKDQTLYIHTENTNERYVQLDDNVKFHIRGTDENGKRDGSYTTYTNARSAMNRLGAQQADDSYLFTGSLVAICDPATGFATAVIINDAKFEAPANTPMVPPADETDIQVISFNPATGAMSLYGSDGDTLDVEQIAKYLEDNGYTDIAYDGVASEWSYKKGIASYAEVSITQTEVFKLSLGTAKTKTANGITFTITDFADQYVADGGTYTITVTARGETTGATAGVATVTVTGGTSPDVGNGAQVAGGTFTGMASATAGALTTGTTASQAVNGSYTFQITMDDADAVVTLA